MMMYSFGIPGFGAGCSSVMSSCDSSGVGCVGRRVIVMLCLLLYSFVSMFVFLLSAMAMILCGPGGSVVVSILSCGYLV